MNRISDVVKNLIIINVVVFIGQLTLPEHITAYLPFHNPKTEAFQPFQIISHMFAHGSVTHIFFNMFGLFMFGSPLEYYWGPKKFLTFYLATGLGALAVYLGAWYLEGVIKSGENVLLLEQYLHQPFALLGASGAVFGILAGFAMKFPNQPLMFIFFPVPIKAKYMVMIYGALELFQGLNPGFMSSAGGPQVAHFAHVGGALVGILMVLFWRKNGMRQL